MSPIALRPTESSDIAAIAAIYGEAVLHGTASFELEPPSEAEMERRFRGLVDSGYPHLVATADGRIAGYGYAGPYRPRPAHRHSVEDSVYLAPGAQGRGIGGMILAELIRECESRGFRQMVAVIGDSAHRASIRLHERAGFTLVGTFRDIGHKHGRWLDSVLMQRPLGPGSSLPPSR